MQLLQQASAAGNLGTLAGIGNLGGAAAAGNGNNCCLCFVQKRNIDLESTKVKAGRRYKKALNCIYWHQNVHCTDNQRNYRDITEILICHKCINLLSAGKNSIHDKATLLMIISGMNVLQVQSLLAAATAAASALQNNPGKKQALYDYIFSPLPMR